MAGINKVILIGNLGKDPEVRTIDNGAKVATFSLATTETFRSKSGDKVEQTEWHNIVLWRGLAEVAEKYLKKGVTVYIEGKIRTRKYEKDGQSRYITEIVGDTMTMLSRKDSGIPQPQDSPPPIGPDNEPTGEASTNDLPF